MSNVQKLKEMIDQAEKRQDITCGEELARFLDEQGVLFNKGRCREAF